MSPQQPIQSAEVTQSVVDAVAEAEGVSPESLERPLYDVVDPDALERLCSPSRDQSATVAFTYYGYHVRVSGDGAVSLARADL